MEKETIKICHVTTTYSLFLYFLINGYNEDDLFIFTFTFPENVSKNLKCVRMPKVFFTYGPIMIPIKSVFSIFQNILGYIKYFYGYIKLRIILFYKTYNKKVEVYGHAQTPFGFMFFENENSNIIEDGSFNYYIKTEKTHKINPIVDMFLHICGIYFIRQTEAFGSHKNIKHVYLTHSHNDPLINDKIKLLNIEESWNNLSDIDKNEILRVFNLDNFKGENFNQEAVLLLTEPFSDEGLLTIEEELRIYQELINTFQDKKIIIKPHPREKKDYSKIFSDLDVLESSFPVELLELIGFNPDIVCSIAATALFNFKHSKIYIYEGETSSEAINNIREVMFNKLRDLDNEKVLNKF